MRRIMLMVMLAAFVPFVANAAGGPAPSATIAVRVQAPPSVESSLTIVLLRDGADVTDELCDRSISDGRSAYPQLLCDEVPDGTYELSVTSLDPAVRISQRCDDVATPVDPIVIGDFRSISCDVVASTPGVLLGVDAEVFPPPVPAPPIGRLLAADGTDVTAACEPDVVNEVDRLWCTDLADGAYTAVADFPDGYLGDVVCAPTPTLREGFGPGPNVVLSSDDWLWSCVPLGPYAPLTITIGSAGNEPAPAWLDELSWSVVGTDDVTASCGVVRVLDGPVPPPFVEIHCLDVPDGTYDVTVTGIPPELSVESFCEDVAVVSGVPSTCAISIAPPAVEPPPETQPSLPDELPATGAGSAATAGAVGIAAIAAGAIGLVLARSRTRRA